MGATHSSPFYAVPSRPFHKHGHHRSCLGTAIAIPRQCYGGSTSGRRNHRHRSASTLIQLILLQDWQRVLIRTTLFPKEITKSCVIELYGKTWKVLPLHLACALQPPPKVVSALMVGASAMIPVERPQKGRRWKPRPKALTVLKPSNRKWDDPEELKSVASAPISLPSAVANDSTNSMGQNVWTSNRFSMFSGKNKNISAFSSGGSLVSLEQSIGDVTGTSSCATNSATDDTSTNDFDYDGDDDESSIGNLFLDGVFLQLTPSGEITPMNMPMQSHEGSTTSEDDDDEDEVSVQDMNLPGQALIQIAAEAQTLLPIHIACLYQASPSVLELLLQAHPMGSLSAVLGMLPIHIAAAGWKAEPLVPPTQFLSTMQICDRKDRDSSEDGLSAYTMASLRVLIRAAPETETARSSLHGLLAKEYIENNLKDIDSENVASILAQTFLSSSFSGRLSSQNEDNSSVHDEIMEVAPSEMQSLTKALSSGPPSTQPPLFNLLMQQEWIAVCTLVESDPHQAREWYYGMDPSNNCSSLTPAAPVVWKRLALHVACMVGAPLQVMKALIRAHPAALQLSDPHSGAAPLHLACGLGADISTLQLLLVPGATKVTDARGRMPIHHAMIAQAPYGIVEWLIRCDPASVLCPDREGKTPLQLAHQSYPAGSSVLGLLELVWM